MKEIMIINALYNNNTVTLAPSDLKNQANI